MIDETSAAYRGRHYMVAKARGKASEYTCEWCVWPADHWATIHGTDGSDPMEHYLHLCARCHKRYDARPGRRITAKTRRNMAAAQQRRRQREFREMMAWLRG